MISRTFAPITVTGVAQHQAWAERITPPVEQVRPSLWSIPIDFGHSPIRYTFCYVVSNRRGESIVIDPGGDSLTGRAQFQAALELAGLDRTKILGVVSTHFHPDHLGMVGHVAGSSGAWSAMHADDAALLEVFADTAQAISNDRSWLTEAGVPAGMLSEMLFTADSVAQSNSMARPTRYLADGERLPLPGRTLVVASTPGHTPGHVCVVDEDNKVIFTGDHLLPRITPNVGLAPTRERRNALSQYYRSLERMSEWAEYEALPAHEYRFRGVGDRAAALAEHHDQRAAEILACFEGRAELSLWELGPNVSWSRGWDSLDGVNMRAALSELAAHVYDLVSHGRLDEIAVDRGPIRFRRRR